MDFIIVLKAVILGVIEGLTEFLPISSTGHLIVFGSLLDFHSSDNVFEIAIQLGAILAVLVEYRQRFTHVLTHIGRDKVVNQFVCNLAIAFLPAAIIGLCFHQIIEDIFFNPISVATALVLGGLVMLWIEKRHMDQKARVTDVDSMKARDALVIGLAQVLALMPGVSRSGSTIMGGMWWGVERKVATEFSFFLAVPVMIAATGYKLVKHWSSFHFDEMMVILVGFLTAFFAALLAIKALLKFVAAKNYIPFAYYRIIFGVFILATYGLGWVKWS